MVGEGPIVVRERVGGIARKNTAKGANISSLPYFLLQTELQVAGKDTETPSSQRQPWGRWLTDPQLSSIGVFALLSILAQPGFSVHKKEEVISSIWRPLMGLEGA